MSIISNSNCLIRNTNIREMQKQLTFLWRLCLYNICILTKNLMDISRHRKLIHKFNLWDNFNISTWLIINLPLSNITLIILSNNNFTIQGSLISLTTIVIPLLSNFNTKRDHIKITISNNLLSNISISKKFRIDKTTQASIKSWSLNP
jgi:hypothetical protein